ncbi:hypothetical protein TNCV_4254431 [Trichonephila clavipes]|nr:hypothetical protein TNCV_4254431 [Trichonephila clavipes]
MQALKSENGRSTLRDIDSRQRTVVLKATKFVPKLLSVEQKERRHAAAQDLLETIDAESGSLQRLAVSENENAIERTKFSE